MLTLRVVGLLLVCAMTGVAQNSRSTTTPKSAYVDSAMRNDGNASRGRELFHNEQKTACAKCHSLDGSSSKAGPDLAFVGDKFPRRELIRSVLEPSSGIAVGYGTTTVEL